MEHLKVKRDKRRTRSIISAAFSKQPNDGGLRVYTVACLAANVEVFVLPGGQGVCNN